MFLDYYFEHLEQADLNVYHCGTHDCDKGHFYGPSIRDHFLIHYIVRGKGIFKSNGITYSLEKGQGFLIFPDDAVYYQASISDPWSYCWVGFQGKKAASYLQNANLTKESPIFTYTDDAYISECISRMIAVKSTDRNRELKQLGLLYFLLSKITETVPEYIIKSRNVNMKEAYINKAISFIVMNYSQKISIKQIAKHIGLDRSYFCTVFKTYFKISPIDFLINFRINKACELLIKKEHTIGDISRSVGYSDYMQFSRAFKKVKGIWPSEYRKSPHQEEGEKSLS